jgi:hypothetical protein
MLYGPYHRLESPTQTAETAEMQCISQEIWGKARRPPYASETLQVKAYNGPLPSGARGIEFMTEVEPDSFCPPNWSSWSEGKNGVRSNDKFAIISAIITKCTQN